MSDNEFVDHYDILEVSPSASAETISRVFRYLGRRLHPDTPDTGDPEKFIQLVNAYRTLSNAVTRAKYDSEYHREKKSEFRLKSEAGNATISEDQRIRLRLLMLFYTQRKRNMKSPGIGDTSVQRMMACPPELSE